MDDVGHEAARGTALRDRLTEPRVIRDLLDQIDTRLAIGPDSLSLRLNRGSLLRAVGDLSAAADALADLDDARASRLTKILTEQPIDWRDRDGPAPFVLFHGVLSAAEQGLLWEALSDGLTSFTRAKIDGNTNGRVDETVRQAALLTGAQKIRTWFLPRLVDLIDAPVLARLGLDAVPSGKTELQITRHDHGGFYRPHYDVGRSAPLRRLTYVYYFHRQPRRFQGGDLALFDAPLPDVPAGPLDFTRITPEHNSLILFPSNRRHAVTPVASDSADPLDGRMTVNGWFNDPAAPDDRALA